MDYAEDEDDDLTLLHRRRKAAAAARRTRLVLSGVVAACLLVGLAVVVLFAVRTRQQAEVALRDAEAMAADARNRRGPIPVPAGAAPSPQREGETWTHAELVAYLKSRGVAVTRTEPTHEGAHEGPAVDFWSPDDERLYVQKRATAADARDQAGAGGAGSFSWGRFLFLHAGNSPKLSAAIRAALRAG
jgi:hypothetical protein